MKNMRWRREVILAALVVGVGTARGADGDGEAAPARPPPVLVAQVGHGNTVTSAAVSADGRWLLTGSYDYTARLWDLEGGRELRRFEGARSVVTAVAFTPDARGVLTGHYDRTARLWDRVTGKEIRRYEGHGGGVTAVDVSADGAYVLTGSDDRGVRLFERESGREVRRFDGCTDKVGGVALSADGRWVLAGAQDKVARVWSRETGQEVRRFEGHGDRLTAVAFSPDARWVLTGSQDKTARLWDREAGTELKRYPGHGDRVTSVAFSPDARRVLTGSWDSQARLWDREAGTEVRRFAGHTALVSAVRFTPDGRRVVTGSYDRTARLWDAETGTERTRYDGLAAGMTAVAATADTRWIATGGSDGVAHLWDRDDGAESRTLTGHGKAVTSVALSADGAWVLTGSEDRTARLWSGKDGKELRRFEGHGDRVAAVGLSADGQWALTASDDKTARLWEAASGREVRRFEGHGDRVSAAVFSSDGAWVLTGCHDRSARLFERDTGRLLRTFTGHTGQVSAVAISADRRWVVTGSYDKGAIVWSADTGAQVRRIDGHTAWITCVAVAADGSWVLTGSMDGSARRWNSSTGAEMQRYEGHGGWVTALAPTAEGKRLLTASADGTVRLWDLETRATLCSLLSFRDGSWAVVDPAGRYDASREGRVEGLHWVVGDEVIALEQLMSAFYEPRLLARVALPPGAPPVARLEVRDIRRLPLHPGVRVTPPTGPDGVLRIDLEDHGGGVGRVVVKIDGQTVAEPVPQLVARGAGGAPGAAEATASVPLGQQAALAPGRTNTITVEAYNAEGSLRSRGVAVDYKAPGSDVATPPAFWAVVAGVSEYAGAAIRLRYSAKDAQDFADAITAAAAGLFGAERIHATVLTTVAPRAPPTRPNLLAALVAAQAAAPDDVFVLYLSGHGVTHGTPPDYYFLTQEATALGVEDETTRAQRALSAADLQQALGRIKARKKILVFDTCRAGQAAADLAGRGDDGGTQARVMARVRQAMGTYVLAGCAADKVSYEASRFAQGLLTYALLEAMKLGVTGAVRDGDLLEAGGLLQYALRRVPEIARGIGGIQDPQVTVPDNATAVDLGRITERVRSTIRLADQRPLLARPDFQLAGDAPGDPQGLTRAVHDALSAAAEGRGGPALAYLPGQESPGMVRLAARYARSGDKLRLRVYVLRLTSADPQDLGQFDAEGAVGALPDLATRLVAQAIALLKPS